MSLREAYVPPIRQSEANNSGNRTPSIHHDNNNTVANNNGSSSNNADDVPEDANIIVQSPARRTNIVSAATASRSLNQPQRIWSKTPQTAVRLDYATADKKVPYLCASCGFTTRLTANDMLRCVNCGGVTMYKPRVKQYVFGFTDWHVLGKGYD
jgi:DNA-directed RNA polymerase subunit RPC12/RpoP